MVVFHFFLSEKKTEERDSVFLKRMNLDNFVKDLTCPITGDLFEDPVQTPCCRQPFTRVALAQWLANNSDCPKCRGNIADFDVATAPQERTLQSMADAIRSQQAESQAHTYKCTLSPITESVAQLQLTLENGKFTPKPTLIILALDRSGSMMGNPWNQVRQALVHIVGLAHTNPLVKLVVITYESIATVIDTTTGTIQQIAERMRNLPGGGGTNFRAAFTEICRVLKTYTCSDAENLLFAENNVGSASIAFLTDGQDCSGSQRHELAPQFKEDLADAWNGPIEVHAIGFSQGHDREFLESLLTPDGTFRYAEPQDETDALCQKIQSLFEMAARSASAPLQLKLSNGIMTLDGSSVCDTRLVLDRKQRGSLTLYVQQTVGVEPADMPAVRITSSLDRDVKVPIQSFIRSEEESRKLYDTWLSIQLDEVANQLIQLQSASAAPRVTSLACGLMLQRLQAMEEAVSSQATGFADRVSVLRAQTEAIQSGNAVNLNKLSDLRFGSRFTATKSVGAAAAPAQQTVLAAASQPVAIASNARWEEHTVRYSHSNMDKNRNAIQCALVSANSNRLTGELSAAIDRCTLADLLHTDVDGNNTVHLAVYCGLSYALERLLERFGSDIDVNAANTANETPMTLAIKARGFWKCIKLLLKYGAIVPENRREGLIEYTTDNGYTVTRDLLVNLPVAGGSGGAISTKINTTMTADYIRFVFERVCETGSEFDVQSYLDVFLAKGLNDIVEVLIGKFGAKPTLEMLYKYAYPPKPDDPETDRYLQLTQVLLQAAPELLDQTDGEKNNPLHYAVERGSLPHVRYYLDRSGKKLLETRNELGNTPLWLACARRYPCIIDELLDRGAQITATNDKGNSPIYSVCQRGPLKVAEKLLARGADPYHVNRNGDTLVLLCCRNGQTDILKLLLGMVDPEFVDHKAHIDGFNAIFASVEADRPECIESLHEYGVSLEQFTDKDNEILAGATPLHLAAYYGRTASARKLLELGANPNCRDIAGRTPLHIAVIQKQPALIGLLRSNGADITALDDMNNAPAVYCRGEPELRKALVDPALDSMLALVQGQFSPAEEGAALAIIKQHAECCQRLGHRCLSIDKSMSRLRSNDGTDMLTNAVIYGRWPVVEILTKLLPHYNPKESRNTWGVDCSFWIARGNPRIRKHFEAIHGSESLLSKHTEAALERLSRGAPHDHMLFLASSAVPTEMMLPSDSGIAARMAQYANFIVTSEDARAPLVFERITSSRDPLEDLKQQSPNISEALIRRLLWESQILATNAIVSGGNREMNAKELITLALYTSSAQISSSVNRYITEAVSDPKSHRMVCELYHALRWLSPFEGEVFIGCESIERKRFAVGTEFYWNTFMSGSALWRVATEPLGDFGTKDKGTVFIVHSRKTGRHVGQLSMFSFDAEVIFPPGTRFRVIHWYRGNPIALGQANIREHTFGLEEEDIARYAENQKSLIIELEEINE